MNVETIKSKRIIYLICSTLTLLVAGLIYAWSNFARAILVDFPGYAAYAAQVFQVSMIAFCVAIIVGSLIVRKKGPKIALIVASVLFATGFIATSLTSGLGIWAFFIFYSIVGAFGVGIAYNAIVSATVPWFPEVTGVATGVLLMGFGVSSLVFGFISQAAYEAIGWSNLFFVVAILGFVMMLGLAFIIKPAPAGLAAILKGQESAPTADKAAAPAAPVSESPTRNQNILTTKVYWLFACWIIILIACGLTLIGTSGQGLSGLSSEWIGFTAILVGLVGTVNGAGRVINGWIFDKFGLNILVFVMTFVCLLATAGLFFAFVLKSPILYVVAAILIAFPYGGCPVIATAMARSRFSMKDFPKNIGFLNFTIAPAAILNIIIIAIVGPIAVDTALVNAPVIYGILLALAVVATILSVVLVRTYMSDMAKIKSELGEV